MCIIGLPNTHFIWVVIADCFRGLKADQKLDLQRKLHQPAETPNAALAPPAPAVGVAIMPLNPPMQQEQPKAKKAKRACSSNPKCDQHCHGGLFEHDGVQVA